MHTVLIAYTNEIFARGVMALLHDAPEVKVVGMTNDLSAAVESARSLRPHVVILEGSPHEQGAKLQGFLGNASTCRVVALSLETPVATVYEVSDLPMPSASALVSAIRGGGVHGLVVT
jgi:DNA-binding NarL/FixJ family response regulator